MTISEKKIELVQALLLLRDNSTLFEIEKLIVRAFKTQGAGAASPQTQMGKMPESFEDWISQFEVSEQPDAEDEYGLSPRVLRQRIWAAEQSSDLSLEDFFQRVEQN